MATVGEYLRQLREDHGVKLEEIANRTKIRMALLQALEENRFEELPEPVFVRGFIRSYCRALDEDPTQALELYDHAVGGQEEKPPREKMHLPGYTRMVHSSGALYLLILILLLFALAIGYYGLVSFSKHEKSVSAIENTDGTSGTTKAFSPFDSR